MLTSCFSQLNAFHAGFYSVACHDYLYKHVQRNGIGTIVHNILHNVWPALFSGTTVRCEIKFYQLFQAEEKVVLLRTDMLDCQ